jgi:hypothetical protein
MSDRLGLLSRMAVTSLLIAYAGCAPEEETSDEPQVAGGDAELIGGVAANSPTLNAIGTLGVTETYPSCGRPGPVTYDRLVCSASLIAPRVVLTAKHCVDSLLYGGRYATPYFGIGPNALAPIRKVPIVQIERSPVDLGGFNNYGRDVAVVYLGEPVTDVRPLGIAELTTDAIGQRFGAIGYGVQDNAGTSGTRMAGSVTVNALEGRVFELIFGNYEAFRDWFITSGGPIGRPIPPIPLPPGVIIDGGVRPRPDAGVVTDGGIADGGYPDFYELLIRSRYENTLLLPGYEAYVGNRRGDAQLCRGDSGSPLVRASQGQLYAYGVVSGGIPSRELTCDYGAVYASFGPETVQFLQNARNWVDPCDGVTENGQCDGDVATRCTDITEGPRRLTVTDCSLLGQTCAVGSDGRAACATAGEPPVVLEEPDPCGGYPGYPDVPPGVIIDDEGVVIGSGARPGPF